jgi:hypothetical protein
MPDTTSWVFDAPHMVSETFVIQLFCKCTCSTLSCICNDATEYSLLIKVQLAQFKTLENTPLSWNFAFVQFNMQVITRSRQDKLISSNNIVRDQGSSSILIKFGDILHSSNA